jgi:hypothetical protein
MDEKRIQELLAKFYEGNTSLEEERILEDYFSTEDVVPIEWGPEAELFSHRRKKRAEKPAADIGTRFLESIGESEKPSRRIVPLRRLAYLSGAAAAIILLLGAIFLLSKPDLPDTFASADEAYMETINTIKKVSTYWEMGTKDLKPIGEFSKPVNDLQNLSKFSKGVEEMGNLRTINEGMEQLLPLSKMENVKRFLNIEIQ